MSSTAYLVQIDITKYQECFRGTQSFHLNFREACRMLLIKETLMLSENSPLGNTHGYVIEQLETTSFGYCSVPRPYTWYCDVDKVANYLKTMSMTLMEFKFALINDTIAAYKQQTKLEEIRMGRSLTYTAGGR